MARLPDAVLGDAYASDRGWSLLEDLVDVGNRMAGQEGERAAARRVADAFEDAGCREVRIDEFPIPGWWRGESSLTVRSPVERSYRADHEVIALPGTPAGEVEAELVDVGHGTDEEFEAADLEGAVAMASSDAPDADRWIHRMEKYAAAAEAGAVGFVFRNHVEGALPPTGEVGYHERPGPIPAVGVSKELGSRLARWADEAGTGSDGPSVTLSVDCRNDPATSRNVEAVVGPDTDEEVLVTAHVDAHDIAEGANDNGAGCAIVAEAGRLLVRAEGELDTRVRLVTFGAEEIGLYGAYHWADSHDLDDVRAVLNVDGACNSRDLRVGHQGFESLGAAFESVTDELGAPLSTSDTVSPHGDQWAFVEEGVPAAFVSTVSGESGRGWGHTHADTLDKLDVRDLRAVAIQVACAAVAVADEDRTLERRTREAIREELSEGYVRELKVGGRWHYDE
ncbi:peptidase M28 [Halobacteriales archaeon QS_8_69_26]|nr:MAG: peptidase M28 [Halobacteriales archaeon QS_8_69_26]